MGYSSGAGERVVKLTKANVPIPSGVCRTVNCGTPGTVNFVDGTGNPCVNYPLQPGYNPIVMTQLSTGGTADDIWAIY
jgi:hypothetical protein